MLLTGLGRACGKYDISAPLARSGMTKSAEYRQIAAADVILLNKIDLASPAQVDATEELIRGLNPAASLHRTVRGEIDLKHIIGVDAYAARQMLRESRAATEHTSHQHLTHDSHGHDHEHTHCREPTHYELRGISSLQVDCPRLTAAQMDRLDEWIRSVLWERQLPGPASPASIDVLRCKGLFVTDSGELHVLQGVRNIYEIAKVEEDAELGLPDTGKLVFIGKGLDEHVRHSLKEQLNAV